MEKHLESGHKEICNDIRCGVVVKTGPNRRYFITILHAGFNTPENNAGGYASYSEAYEVWAMFTHKALLKKHAELADAAEAYLKATSKLDPDCSTRGANGQDATPCSCERCELHAAIKGVR